MIAIVEGTQIVKRFLILLFLAGCTQHSNDYPVAEVPIKTVHAQTPVGRSTEDFNIISGFMKNETATSFSFLDMADKLVYQKREMGTEISLKDCLLVSSVICPAAVDESSKIFLNKTALKNSQGVDAVVVVSVETPLSLKQFLLNSAGEVVERSDAQENSFSISSFNFQGDEISRIRKLSKNMKEPLLFKDESIFVPKDKKIIRATRTSQNDSSGENLSVFEIEMPGQGLHIFTGVDGSSCSYGFIGTDDSRREFGELNCQDKMRVSTTLFN